MGAEFFQRYLPDPRLESGYRIILEAINVYRAARLEFVAERLSAELAAMQATVKVQTVKDALGGTEVIRRTLDARLVRDKTPGPHLASHVVSEPLPSPGLEGGALGYGDIERLNQAVDPQHPQAGTYWRAIEEGSSHMVGRLIVGYFQPGFAVPAGGEFRQHPFFTTTASGFLSGGSGGAAMRITRPIEAKHFLADGSKVAVVEHESQMQRIQREAIDAMLATASGSRMR